MSYMWEDIYLYKLQLVNLKYSDKNITLYAVELNDGLSINKKLI